MRSSAVVPEGFIQLKAVKLQKTIECRHHNKTVKSAAAQGQETIAAGRDSTAFRVAPDEIPAREWDN